MAPAAQAISGNRRDDRFLHIGDRIRTGVYGSFVGGGLLLVVADPVGLRHIGANAEVFARPGQNNRPDVAIPAKRVKYSFKFPPHRQRNRVALCRPVESDNREAALALYDDVGRTGASLVALSEHGKIQS